MNCARPKRTACCSPTNGTTWTTARRITFRPVRKSGTDTQGKIDGFICSIGTGGTIAGISTFLREKKKDIVIGVADPRAPRCTACSRPARRKRRDGGSITEGIGLGRVTPIIEDIKVDKAYLIPDEEAVPIIFDLLEHEGLCLGGSTGINVAGAIRLAKELGKGKTIVTVLADYGNRYQSKLFNPDFLRSKKLPVPAWLEKQSAIAAPFVKRDQKAQRWRPTACFAKTRI